MELLVGLLVIFAIIAACYIAWVLFVVLVTILAIPFFVIASFFD